MNGEIALEGSSPFNWIEKIYQLHVTGG